MLAPVLLQASPPRWLIQGEQHGSNTAPLILRAVTAGSLLPGGRWQGLAQHKSIEVRAHGHCHPFDSFSSLGGALCSCLGSVGSCMEPPKSTVCALPRVISA